MSWDSGVIFCIFIILGDFSMERQFISWKKNWRFLCGCKYLPPCSSEWYWLFWILFGSSLLSSNISISAVDWSTYRTELRNCSSHFSSMLPRSYTVITSLRGEIASIPLGSLRKPYRDVPWAFLRFTWCVQGFLCSKMNVKEPSYEAESLCS